MIYTSKKKAISVLLTTFRDGLQSCFGGKTRLRDILPAMRVAAEAGIRRFEFGGGARFQAPYFYVGEDPFECMSRMREVVGPDVDLQILTRSVSGVTLTTQRLETLSLQARLMRRHGATIDRNFDFMNDVDNLARTGKPIVEAGMSHQVCVALMGLPFASDQAHTPEFYIDVIRRFIETDCPFHSVCMKDASGTTDPQTVYRTAKGIKSVLPSNIPLSFHTHDTASMAVACYMAAIEGGVDSIDLSVRPLASGTVQPDVRSMAHALKGTGYSLDINVEKMSEIEAALEAGLSEYEFSPETTTPDARVVGFPMPGGAIGPNVHMMRDAGILDRYADVLSEFPEVVRAGGAWTSVTPGSQQYWLQAFNNVLHGRWEKIDAGYGRSVLGYFGKPPLGADPEVVSKASAQLGLEPFEGDPLAVAEDSLTIARDLLAREGIETTEENVFLVAAAIVPGKDLALNEGLRFLKGAPRLAIPLKSAQEPGGSPPLSERVTTEVAVEEGGKTRRFTVTIEPPSSTKSGADARGTASGAPLIDVFSPFQGKVELLEILVGVGDTVAEGQVVAGVEAMKAKHDVKSPAAGRVASLEAGVGTQVSAGEPILKIEA